MKSKYIKSFLPALLCSSVLVFSCKPVEKEEGKKSDDKIDPSNVNQPESKTEVPDTPKYSLEIFSNIELPSINYSINVDDLTKIDSGTEVVITNNPGKYRIFMYKDIETDEVLSYSRNYSFNITKDTNLMIYSVYDKEYYEYYKGEDPIDLNVILMAGQSNMVGTKSSSSDLDSSVKDEYINNTESVKINYNIPWGQIFTPVNGVSTQASGTFVNVDYGQGSQFGPEIGLAKYLSLNSPNKNYYFVKVACGSTGLYAEWNPDNRDKSYINEYGQRYMYKIFKECVTNCLNTLSLVSLKDIEVNIKIKAMCWLQGENDANDETKANNYSANFTKLKNSVRSDFGKYYSNDFKWISALIHERSDVDYVDVINDVLQEKSDRFISESYSLPLGSDGIHYTSQSYLTIGECFGREMLN